MKIACLDKSAVSRIIGFSSAVAASLTLAGNVLAQTSTSTTPKGGTTSALPDAGTTEITYLILAGGVILFVIGTYKLILGFRK